MTERAPPGDTAEAPSLPSPPCGACGRIRVVGVLTPAALYFAMVFGVGFILGPIRVFVVTPQVGERAAQLLEAPIMLAAIVLAARWIIRRFPRLTSGATVAVGLVALACVLAAEFAVMTLFWRMSLPQYVAMRDPVGLAAYLALLLAFALMPLIVSRWGKRPGTAGPRDRG